MEVWQRFGDLSEFVFTIDFEKELAHGPCGSHTLLAIIRFNVNRGRPLNKAGSEKSPVQSSVGTK